MKAKLILRLVSSVAVASGIAVGAAAQPPTSVDPAAVDGVFAQWGDATPGCAVGVGVGGTPVLARAYGMADLEHGVPLTPDSVFEAGSVSKQFTAAAVLLLARDGKLSLDDPVRKHVPELPEYKVPLTIRHMLNHTSGLRDWGSVAGIAGWPRTRRAHTHAHVLDILSRQTALNFTPGTRYSYSNSGYNLAAIIVERVSGMGFAEFTARRIFQPLGMTRTSWRDDFTRIVKDRAIAYDEQRDGFHTLMPFEDVHGNGGLLTTVGDLLTWNRNFVKPTVGDEAFVREQQEPGRFNDGRAHGYALGLMVGEHKGVRQVAHSGSTAGYSAYLARYPDQHLSVAVLCNVATNATQHAQAIADLYLAGHLRPDAPGPGHTLTAAAAAAIGGLYRHATRGTPLSVTADGSGIRAQPGPALIPRSPGGFVTAGGDRWEFDGRGGLTVTDRYGTLDVYQRVEAAAPGIDDLRRLAGTYVSRDAEVTVEARMEGASLVLWRRPGDTAVLTPLYADTFRSPSGTIIFRRDGTGQPNALSIVQDRVWDMRFQRTSATSSQ
jgi:CubicO group peptidase (beta-lactamase class C family)